MRFASPTPILLSDPCQLLYNVSFLCYFPPLPFYENRQESTSAVSKFQDETLPCPRSRSMNPLKHHVPPAASGRKVLGCCDVYPGTTQCRAPLTTGGLGFR